MLEQHTHYDVRGLPLSEKKKLMKKAFELKYNWWVDKLDCRESFCRQKINMSFEEIMGHLTERAYVTLIHRKDRGIDYPDYLEIGFSSMENPVDYLLWIQVPMSEEKKFKKYMKELR